MDRGIRPEKSRREGMKGKKRGHVLAIYSINRVRPWLLQDSSKRTDHRALDEGCDGPAATTFGTKAPALRKLQHNAKLYQTDVQAGDTSEGSFSLVHSSCLSSVCFCFCLIGLYLSMRGCDRVNAVIRTPPNGRIMFVFIASASFYRRSTSVFVFPTRINGG